MAVLIHEVWEELNEDGEMRPGLCLAGPDGDGFRAQLSPGARLVKTFNASSHVEAMNVYYALYGWGQYKTDHEQDYEPYPEKWAAVQRADDSL